MDINSISGFIDLAIPEDKNADINLSTITGTIYSNHDINVEKKPASYLNSVLKTSISGDIFLRKQ